MNIKKFSVVLISLAILLALSMSFGYALGKNANPVKTESVIITKTVEKPVEKVVEKIIYKEILIDNFIEVCTLEKETSKSWTEKTGLHIVSSKPVNNSTENSSHTVEYVYTENTIFIPGETIILPGEKEIIYETIYVEIPVDSTKVPCNRGNKVEDCDPGDSAGKGWPFEKEVYK